MKRRGLGGRIIGILVSIGLIIGGLSGTMVLRGTNSSTALVVAGVIFLIFDIVSLVLWAKKGDAKANDAQYYENNEASGIHGDYPSRSTNVLRVVCAALLLAFITFIIAFAISIGSGDTRMLTSNVRLIAHLNSLARLLFICVLGSALYIVIGATSKSSKVTSIIFLFLALLLSTIMDVFSKAMFPAMLAGQANFRIFINFLSRRTALIPFAYDTGSTAVIVAAGFGISKISKAALRKKVALAACCAAALALVLSFLGRFKPFFVTGGWVFFGYTERGVGPIPGIMYANLYIRHICLAALIFLTALLVRSLCSLQGKTLKTGAGAKVWFIFVLLFNTAAMILSIMSDMVWIIQVITTAVALMGIIIMLAGRKFGWYVYLSGVALSLAYLIPGNGGTAIQAELLDWLPSMLFVLNPIITWLIIRRAFRRDEAHSDKIPAQQDQLQAETMK